MPFPASPEHTSPASAFPDPASPGSATLATGGELPTHIAVHPSGRWLAVSNYGRHPSPGSVSVVRLHRDGSLAEVTGRTEHAGTGPVPSRQDCAHVHSTAFSSAGDRDYVSNRGAVNTIATFDTTRPGRPALIGEAPSGGVWPRHFAVTPDGRFLVVANEHSGQLTALAVDSDGQVAAPVASAAMPGVSYVEVGTA